ncbi:hypothetical protein [Bifidobacterium leontopitheci]|uniref:Lipoprotein n=1 Tax=Bifidobacterium leontopitheci TaxID=2650774 RepID=A0A6I1GFR9_9BIFI|nr:hypothetical protein [Bifidobacterium leontopitheci]KAB7790483.1 hypothetical protein F7D09_0979 [Bifidobacterium leontopitheci]
MNIRKMIVAAAAAFAMVMPLAGCGSDDAQASARMIMDAAQSGNVGSVKARLDTSALNRGAEHDFLDAKPEIPIADVVVGKSEGDRDMRTVPVSYTLAGKQYRTDLNMSRDADGTWKAINPKLFRKVMTDGVTVGGKKTDVNRQGYLLAPGVYRAHTSGNWYSGSWKFTVTASDASADYLDETIAEHLGDFTADDRIKTDGDIHKGIAKDIDDLDMCNQLNKLYLDGESYALIVGDSIPYACRYQVSDVQPTITSYEKSPDDDGRFLITYDAKVTGTVAEFRRGGRTDDEWTCMYVSDKSVQCARFVERTFEVKGLRGECSIDGGVWFPDRQQAAEQVGDVIYAGHGTI